MQKLGKNKRPAYGNPRDTLEPKWTEGNPLKVEDEVENPVKERGAEGYK